MLKSMSEKFCLKPFKEFFIIRERNSKSLITSILTSLAMTEKISFFLSPLPLGEGAQRAGEGLKLKYAFRLAEGASRVVTLDSSRKIAFTLAEVLITLGIIGVIAAITLPMLIGNYEKMVTVNRLKKTYSMFQQSINMARVKYEEETLTAPCNSTFDCYLSLEVKYYLIEELKPSKCNSSGLSNYVSNIRTKLGGYSYHAPEDYCYVLNDGTVFFYTDVYGYVVYLIDINGIKKPNRLGKDMFVFVYVPSFHMPYPNMRFGDPGSREKDLGVIRTQEGVNPGLYLSGYDKNGGDMCGDYPNGGCTNKISQDGWQIKSDYPWK